ncbi:MAG: hypothetical protein F6J87_02670 [Spirulina sp. SIO3F2]|nr:hypothetical protein [Spirulina sp. SIO3F2]
MIENLPRLNEQFGSILREANAEKIARHLNDKYFTSGSPQQQVGAALLKSSRYLFQIGFILGDLCIRDETTIPFDVDDVLDFKDCVETLCELQRGDRSHLKPNEIIEMAAQRIVNEANLANPPFSLQFSTIGDFRMSLLDLSARLNGHMRKHPAFSGLR